MHRGAHGRGFDMQHFAFGCIGLGRGNKAVVQHALNDVLLADARALGVFDRVKGRRRLGQAGQHGGFGHRDVLERLAKIGLAGGGKTIGPVAQINLVHVDFQNLVFAQVVFELERQQHLVNLACKRLLGR